MAIEVIPVIMSMGGLLAGIAATVGVVVQRRNSKEDTGVKHSDVVLGSYGELVDRLEKRLDAVSVTVERQGEEITSLKIELRDRDDQIKLLTLDRDDLVSLLARNDVGQPPLRTV